MKAFLQEQADIPLEYNEQLVRRLVEKVTVYESKAVVEFKSGLKNGCGAVEQETFYLNFMNKL